MQKKGIRHSKYLVIVITIIITFILCNGCEKKEISFPVNEEGITRGLMYASDVEVEDSEAKKIVSLTSFENGFLGAFYGYLYYFDEKEKNICEVQCPDGYYAYSDILEGVGNIEKIWYPTGCFYNNKDNLLYIANYHGHNILVCSMEDDLTCEVVNVIATESMVSPENLYINKDGIIAVADYDGNLLFLFDKNGELLWSKDIKLAHGVAMSDRYVYVTSLYDRTISKFDLNGNLIKKIGELGYEGKDKFMWPVSLDYFNNRLLITDAHTGRLYLYDDDLNYISSIGGNGASNNTFNFPYSANFINNSIYVTDVFNSRIVKLNANGEIISIWGEAINLEDDLVFHPYRNIPYSYGVIADIDSNIVNPYIDATVVSGYGGLYFVADDGGFQLNMSDYLCNQSIFDLEAPYIEQPYITWIKKISYNAKIYYVIGSTQTRWHYFIYNETDKLFYMGRDADLDVIWYIEGNWYSKGEIDQKLKSLIRKSEKHTVSFLELRNKGIDRKTAYEISFLDYYNDIFGIDMTIDEFDVWLSMNFSSEWGKEFWNNYDENEAGLKELTDTYFFNTSSGGSHLCEMFFVHTFGNYAKAEEPDN